jgi:ribosomal protein S14
MTIDTRNKTQAKAENRANKMRRKKYGRAIGDNRCATYSHYQYATCTTTGAPHTRTIDIHPARQQVRHILALSICTMHDNRCATYSHYRYAPCTTTGAPHTRTIDMHLARQQVRHILALSICTMHDDGAHTRT